MVARPKQPRPGPNSRGPVGRTYSFHAVLCLIHADSLELDIPLLVIKGPWSSSGLFLSETPCHPLPRLSETNGGYMYVNVIVITVYTIYIYIYVSLPLQ